MCNRERQEKKEERLQHDAHDSVWLEEVEFVFLSCSVNSDCFIHTQSFMLSSLGIIIRGQKGHWTQCVILKSRLSGGGVSLRAAGGCWWPCVGSEELCRGAVLNCDLKHSSLNATCSVKYVSSSRRESSVTSAIESLLFQKHCLYFNQRYLSICCSI